MDSLVNKRFKRYAEVSKRKSEGGAGWSLWTRIPSLQGRLEFEVDLESIDNSALFHRCGIYIHLNQMTSSGYCSRMRSPFSSFCPMQITKANTVTFTMNYLISPDKVLCGLTQSFKRLGCGVRAAGAVQELHVLKLTAMMASDLIGRWDSLMFRCFPKPQLLLPPCIRLPRRLGLIIPPGDFTYEDCKRTQQSIPTMYNRVSLDSGTPRSYPE